MPGAPCDGHFRVAHAAGHVIKECTWDKHVFCTRNPQDGAGYIARLRQADVAAAAIDDIADSSRLALRKPT